MDSEIINSILEMENQNDFAKYCGIHVTKLDDGYCEAECELQPNLMNIRGSAHGGLLFTLIDRAGAFAMGTTEEGFRPMVTQNASVYFLRPATEGKLLAKAQVIRRGRTTGLVCVEVFNSQGKMAVRSDLSFYFT